MENYENLSQEEKKELSQIMSLSSLFGYWIQIEIIDIMSKLGFDYRDSKDKKFRKAMKAFVPQLEAHINRTHKHDPKLPKEDQLSSFSKVIGVDPDMAWELIESKKFFLLEMARCDLSEFHQYVVLMSRFKENKEAFFKFYQQLDQLNYATKTEQ